MKRVFPFLLLIGAMLPGVAIAQGDLLDRVPELQETARKASGGVLGCGSGKIAIITSRGVITVPTGLDPIHVFGSRIDVKDLLRLMNARIEANEKGSENAMSGDVDSLAYVVIDILTMSRDPIAIPTLEKLLQDRNSVIHGWAAISLIQLASHDDELKRLISAVRFPQAAIRSAAGRGANVPVWAIVVN